jgi:WD40 repeat protein
MEPENDLTDPLPEEIRGYLLHERIGAGAYGAVFRATQRHVNRDVAIKVILAEHANRPSFIRRFEAEAHIVAQLEHFHIVPLYDYWREPKGAYLVMRLMHGGSLAGFLASETLDLPEISNIFEQICSALTAAHRKGVIHRDLKPANILLDESGNAYLSDFGIAKTTDIEGNATGTGAIIGSPGYISPEQVQSAAVSPQSDIYSLGVVLYELLIGQHPFPDTPVGGLLIKQVSEPLPNLSLTRPDLPPQLEAIVQRATAKDPFERYPDVHALLADFRQALSQSGHDLPLEIDAVVLANPYKGLRAFREADTADYFGRERLINRLLERLAETGAGSRFLAVVGPSGSGKSSLIRAGLLPALRRGSLQGAEDWFIVDIVPGPSPVEELARSIEKIARDRRQGLVDTIERDDGGLWHAARLALPSDQDELLLVIDQFEELFTLVQDPEQASFVLDRLAAAVAAPESPIRILITLRADFYDRPLLHPEFGSLIRDRTEVIIPLSAEELAQAIQAPANRVGVEFEDGLVTAIAADILEQPGALPLLQYALTELFERRDGRLLTFAAYAEIGGVLGALGRRAEEIYNLLDESRRFASRQMFLRLVTLGEGTEDTRRRALQSELQNLSPKAADDQTLDELIEVYGSARLLTYDHDPVTRGPTVEVAHEALLREWPRLRGWLDGSRNDVRQQRMLSAAAAEWDARGRQDGYLLRGARLDQFASWAETSSVALLSDELAFLNAGLDERRNREQEQADRLAHERFLERRSRNILRWLAAVMAVAAVVAIGLSAFALNQQGLADRQAELARQNAATATVAQGQAQIDAATAVSAQEDANNQAAIAATNIVLAEEARSSAESEARIALARELAGGAIVNSDLEADPELGLLLALAAADLTFLEDGILTAEAEAALHRALEAALPRLIFKFPAHTYLSASTNPDGTLLATAGHPTTARNPVGGWLFLWDVSPGQSLEQLMAFSSHPSTSRDAAISPDGKTVATSGNDKTAKLWDFATGKEILTFVGHTDSVVDLEFSPDGNRLATASTDETAKVWDVLTGQLLITLVGHTDQIRKVAFNPAGSILATASRDQTAVLWDAETGQKLTTLRGHNDTVNELAFSPDGKLLLTAGEDGIVVIWDTFSGQKLETICCHKDFDSDSEIYGLAVHPAGNVFVTAAGRSGSTKLWSLEIDGSSRILYSFTTAGGSEDTSAMDFSPDGLRLYVPAGERGLEVWDFSLGRELPPLFGFAEAVVSAAYNLDGSLLATTGADGAIQVWEIIDDNTQARELFGLPDRAHTGSANAALFSPDGSRLATAGSDKLVKIWDVSTDEALELNALTGHTGPVLALSYHPTGTQLASASADRTAIIWDLVTGTESKVLRGHNDQVLDAAYSSDGSKLATASADGSAIIWDGFTGAKMLSLQDHDGPVHSVVFSPDGTQIVTAGADRTAIIWNTETGERLVTLSGHSAGLNRALFTPDGERIITVSDDGTSKVWEAATGRELFALFGHVGAVLNLAISPDGSRMVTTGADQMVNFYILDPTDLVEFARSLLTRGFSEAECQRYLHVESCPQD